MVKKKTKKTKKTKTKLKVKESSVKRLYNLYNNMSKYNLKAVDLIDLNRNDLKRVLHSKKMSKDYYKSVNRLFYQLADKEEQIVRFHKKNLYERIGYNLGENEEKGYRMDFLENVSLTVEDETYYSAHYKPKVGKERHIYAPTLKELNEILQLLEESYNTSYKRTSIKVVKYKAFIDREMQTELQQYIR